MHQMELISKINEIEDLLTEELKENDHRSVSKRVKEARELASELAMTVESTRR